jgi:transcriptional regulator with XRE-family HTH domain
MDWIFVSDGAVRNTAPSEAVETYKEMVIQSFEPTSPIKTERFSTSVRPNHGLSLLSTKRVTAIVWFHSVLMDDNTERAFIMDGLIFGNFLTQKRLELDMTLRGFAKKVGVSPVHMSNMENNKRAAPRDDLLEKIADHLLLDKADRAILFDLAAKSKNFPAAPHDLLEYINSSNLARKALRKAIDAAATDAEWEGFIAQLNKRAELANRQTEEDE